MQALACTRVLTNRCQYVKNWNSNDCYAVKYWIRSGSVEWRIQYGYNSLKIYFYVHEYLQYVNFTMIRDEMENVAVCWLFLNLAVSLLAQLEVCLTEKCELEKTMLALKTDSDQLSTSLLQTQEHLHQYLTTEVRKEISQANRDWGSLGATRCDLPSSNYLQCSFLLWGFCFCSSNWSRYGGMIFVLIIKWHQVTDLLFTDSVSH